MKGNKKTQNKKHTQEKTDNLNDETLQHEIAQYLKITEEIRRIEEVNPEDEKLLKQTQQERENQIKALIEQKDSEQLFNKTLEMIKETAVKELLESDINLNIDLLTKKNREFADSSKILSKKYFELESYNKNLLEKTKQIMEEKKKLEEEEMIKKNEIEKKCAEFKKDVEEKFTINFPEIDKIKEENSFLQQKLDEYRENTEKIRDNILAQIKLKDEATIEAEKKTKEDLSSKMKEVEKGNTTLKEENKKLSLEVGKEKADADKTISRIQKIANDFEIKKKEFEKLINELQNALKENRLLKEKNKTYDDVKADHEKIKGELDLITSKNRKLYEKLKILKEKVDKLKETKI